MPNGSKLWRYRYKFGGKEKMISLGAYPAIGLKAARAARDDYKELLSQGIDPSIDKQETKIRQTLAIENDFQSVARSWWTVWQVGKNIAYAKKVWHMFEVDVFPFIGGRALDAIKQSTILLILKNIVKRGALDTVKKIHQRIVLVFRYAITHELTQFNPAEKLILDDIVPKRKTKNQTRIDLKELPQLLRDIDAYDGNAITRHALQFMALSFVRTSELIKAEWSEFDILAGLWRIPPERMKMDAPHIVPLSRQALALLHDLRKITGGGVYLFPSIRGDGKCMSNNTMLYALYRMGYHSRMTGHGFRSVASTALNERGYDERHIELQLSHLTGNAVQRAYDHSKHLEARATLMQAWADYLDEQRGKGKVIKLHA
jgi:integrase